MVVRLQVAGGGRRVIRRKQANCQTPGLSWAAFRLRQAFTMVELLTVIVILGILAALVVPAIRSLGKSNANLGATAQFLADVGHARQLAIADHTTVYMVFVPTNFWVVGGITPPNSLWWKNLTLAQQTVATNLCDKQLSGYTFVAYGALGDQPGQHQWHYLAPWQSLPDGTFIAASKFLPPYYYSYIPQWEADYHFSPPNLPVPIFGFHTNAIPFPTADSPAIPLPCIAFNYQGELTTNGVDMAIAHEYIPLAHGSVVPAVDQANHQRLVFGPAQISENPPGNSTNIAYSVVDIDPLTGRATLEFHQVQ